MSTPESGTAFSRSAPSAITDEHVDALFHYTKPPMSRDAKAVRARITHDLQGAGWITWRDLGEGHAWCLTEAGLTALRLNTLMDPNATLRKLRELVMRVQGGTGRVDPEEFAELVEALDGWLTSGGFLPEAWDGAISGHE
jgi:hypothetical protein